jgi:hypothetical protein
MPVTLTDAQLVELLKSAIKPHSVGFDWLDALGKVTGFFGTVVGIGGLILGHRWATQNDEKKRRLDFIEKQLREFYGPLKGCYSDITYLCNFLGEVAIAHNAEVEREARGQQALPIAERRQARMATAQRRSENPSPEISYNLQAYQEQVLPLYAKMRDIMRENTWLADDEVLKHWPNLVKFVDSWTRTLSGRHDPEVSSVYRVSAKRLEPFCELIEFRVSQLQRKLKAGNPDLLEESFQGSATVAEKDDKPFLLEVIEGFKFYPGNIPPQRITDFRSATLMSQAEDKDGRPIYTFMVSTEDDEERQLQVEVLREKHERGGNSRVRLTLLSYYGD